MLLCDVTVGIVPKKVRMRECAVSTDLSTIDGRRCLVEWGGDELGNGGNGHDGEVDAQFCRGDLGCWWE